MTKKFLISYKWWAENDHNGYGCIIFPENLYNKTLEQLQQMIKDNNNDDIDITDVVPLSIVPYHEGNVDRLNRLIKIIQIEIEILQTKVSLTEYEKGVLNTTYKFIRMLEDD